MDNVVTSGGTEVLGREGVEVGPCLGSEAGRVLSSDPGVKVSVRRSLSRTQPPRSGTVQRWTLSQL